MSTPLIGLTTRNFNHPKYGLPLISSPKTYSQALVRAGAIPILVPVNLPPDMISQLLKNLDGLLFTGGGDIDLKFFEGDPHPKIYDIDLERDEQELALARAAVSKKIPLLGICRGLQVINVALGGTLYTHINDQLPAALEHSCFPAFPPDHAAHSVAVTPGSLLSEILGTTQIEVNSLHHQGAKTLADGLEVLATAPDGLVEAVQIASHPFGLAVQWHPEWMPAVPEMQAIFSRFASHASQ